MRLIVRVLAPSLCALTLSGLAVCGSAGASTTQLAMFQPGAGLLEKPVQTLTELRALGVGIVRVPVTWSSIAPEPSSMTRPANFNANDPNAYPALNWAPYDGLVRTAHALGIQLAFVLTGGVPLWADTHPIPPASATPLRAWLPSAPEYGAFVHAVGLRYDGHFTPSGQTGLPQVSFWAIWNEPNFGQDIAPQASKGSSILTAAAVYRRLLDAGWRGLQSSGHARDVVLIGSLAARGSRAKPTRGNPDGRPGTYGETKPLQFLRALYCVGTAQTPLKGSSARVLGCPTRPSTFRSSHPGLFAASGVAIHPYPISTPPPVPDTNDPDYAELGQIPSFASTLDAVQRSYGSHRKYPIYITEYGYVTNPPNRSGHFVSPGTAAKYINWAEYLFYRNPRIATTMQFLLADPNPRIGVPEFGGFASGIEFFGGRHKPSYDAYRMPLYLPLTTQRRGRRLEVWGDVRPAHYAAQQTHQTQRVQIQFRRSSRGSFTTLRTVRITNLRGYFDIMLAFPATGTVRLAWNGAPVAATLYSRTDKVTVR